MKALLIPPIPNLDIFGHNGMHLVLSHLLSDERYMKHYRREAEDGAYVILDNDCHEHGFGQSGSILLENARDLKASEVVCPDELFSSDGTLMRTRHFFEYLVTGGFGIANSFWPRLRYMMVPQGTSAEDWAVCLANLLSIYSQFHRREPDLIPAKPVIGLSKDFEIWHGGLYQLIEKYLYSLVLREEIDLHVLGWGRQLWKYAQIARDFNLIRSTDSAKPFVYAANNILLDPKGKPPEYPKRHPGYFTTMLTSDQIEIAGINADLFRFVAIGYFTPEELWQDVSNVHSKVAL